jgi:ATP-dependent RNA helicase RhlE
VAAEEHELLRAIEKLLGSRLPRREVPGFEPTVHSAPPLDLSGGRGRGGRSGGGGGAGAGRARRSANGNNRHNRNR